MNESKALGRRKKGKLKKLEELAETDPAFQSVIHPEQASKQALAVLGENKGRELLQNTLGLMEYELSMFHEPSKEPFIADNAFISVINSLLGAKGDLAIGHVNALWKYAKAIFAGQGWTILGKASVALALAPYSRGSAYALTNEIKEEYPRAGTWELFLKNGIGSTADNALMIAVCHEMSLTKTAKELRDAIESGIVKGICEDKTAFYVHSTINGDAYFFDNAILAYADFIRGIDASDLVNNIEKHWGFKDYNGKTYVNVGDKPRPRENLALVMAYLAQEKYKNESK